MYALCTILDYSITEIAIQSNKRSNEFQIFFAFWFYPKRHDLVHFSYNSKCFDIGWITKTNQESSFDDELRSTRSVCRIYAVDDLENNSKWNTQYGWFSIFAFDSWHRCTMHLLEHTHSTEKTTTTTSSDAVWKFSFKMPEFITSRYSRLMRKSIVLHLSPL